MRALTGRSRSRQHAPIKHQSSQAPSLTASADTHTHTQATHSDFVTDSGGLFWDHVTYKYASKRTLHKGTQDTHTHTLAHVQVALSGMIQCPGDVWLAPPAPLSLSP